MSFIEAFARLRICLFRCAFCRNLAKLILNNYVSVNSSSAHSPPGNRGAFAHVVRAGDGAFAILSRAGRWAFAYPRGDPRASDSRVFQSAVEEFINKDEAFAEDWLVCQGLDKLVDVFNCMFSQFQIFLNYL